MADKRIIEQVTSEEILNDDWLIKDSVTEGTTKVQPSTLKEYVNNGMATAQALLSETQERESNDETLSGRITVETAARTNADLTLDNRITNEVNAREFADTSLSNRIDDLDFSANAISYDNSESGLDSTNIQDAVDEVLDKAGKVDDVQTYGGNTLVTNKIADLSALTIKKSIPSTPTAIATFADGAEMVMPSLTVGVEAVQDLHGYDSPWAGGAGKNKIDAPKQTTLSEAGYVINQEALDIPLVANTYTVAMTCSSNVAWAVNLYDENKVKIIGISSDSATSGRQSKIGVLTQTAYYISIYVNGASTVSDIQLEEGSTATSYAPYSNICPISGWDEVNVTRTGKNLFDKDSTTVVNNKVRDDNGAEVNSSGACYTSSITAVKPNTTYVLNGLPSTPNVSFRIYYLDANGNWLSRTNTINFNSQPYSFTTPNNCGGLQFQLGKANTDFSATQLELGSTATAYEPYAGTTYTIDLDGTRYGGYIEIVNGVARFVATKEYIASYNGETLPSDWISDRDVYSEGITPTIGAEVVYTLATPTIIPLGNYPISSLEGVNNVFADSGEILEGEYIADASAVIAGLDARITALENA